MSSVVLLGEGSGGVDGLGGAVRGRSSIFVFLFGEEELLRFGDTTLLLLSSSSVNLKETLGDGGVDGK